MLLSGRGPHQHPLSAPSHRPTAGRRHRWQARMRPPARLTQLSRWRAPCISSSSCLEQLGASQPGPSCYLSLVQGSCQPTLLRPLSLVEEKHKLPAHQSWTRPQRTPLTDGESGPRKAEGPTQVTKNQAEKWGFLTPSKAWDLGAPHRVRGAQAALPPSHRASARAVLLDLILYKDIPSA